MTLRRSLARTRAVALVLAALGGGAVRPVLGQTPPAFTPAVNLSNSSPYSQIDGVAVDEAQGVYVLWAEFVNDQLWLARSSDGGNTFDPPRLVIPHGEFVAWEQADVSARAAGELHVALTRFDTLGGGAEIFYLRSIDGGTTFAPPIQVSTLDAFNSYVPALALGWAVAVAWGDADIEIGASAVRYSLSLDGGVSFSPPRLLADPAPGGQRCPDVALTGTSTVYAAWSQGIHPDEDVYFSRSTDGGATFSPPANISNIDAKSWCPHVGLDDSGTVVVVWPEGDVPLRELMEARSMDGGQTFSAPRRVSAPGVNVPQSPRLTDAGGGALMVTWSAGELTGDIDCFVALWNAADAIFSAPVATPGCGRAATRSAAQLHFGFSMTPAGQMWPDAFYSRGDDLVFPVFWDVPEGHFARRWIEAVFKARVTSGCAAGPPRYCPDEAVTRAQMAVFLLRSKEGPTYSPPPATGVFADVPVNDPFAPWVEELYRRSVTGGCAGTPLSYCPNAPVTRAQMSVFLLRTEEGPSYVPPPATGLFQDVPVADPFARWIEELARRRITGGCSGSPPLFCPAQAATRAEMAVFLVRTFDLPL